MMTEAEILRGAQSLLLDAEPFAAPSLVSALAEAGEEADAATYRAAKVRVMSQILPHQFGSLMAYQATHELWEQIDLLGRAIRSAEAFA